MGGDKIKKLCYKVTVFAGTLILNILALQET